MLKKIINKIITFLIKKKVVTATGEMEQISKTKLFMAIEGLLRAVEFASPYFEYPIIIPEEIHKMLYTLAGLSYAERHIKK
jgi:hypothetical protein